MKTVNAVAAGAAASAGDVAGNTAGNTAVMSPLISVQYAAPAADLADIPKHHAVRKWVRAALNAAHCAGKEITVRFVGVQESTALNQQYRGKAQATNVLSFDYRDSTCSAGSAASAVFGDIVICAPLIQAEAKRYGKSVQAHCAHLIVHGVLHLAGYRHDTAAAAAAMEQLEGAILAAFNFAYPYEQ